MNLESEVEARNNICQKVERLCDAVNWVVNILRRQLAVELDIADMLVTISVHVGRRRYFCSSATLPDPYADGLDAFTENELAFWWKTRHDHFARDISTALMVSMKCQCCCCIHTN